MLRFKLLLIAFFLTGILVIPAGAEEELPIEIDVDVLSEKMSLDAARTRLNEDIEAVGLQKRNRIRAMQVLENLVDEGIPVNKAYEVVCDAVRLRKGLDDVDSEENIERLRNELRKREEKRNRIREELAEKKEDNLTEGERERLQKTEQLREEETLRQEEKARLREETGERREDFEGIREETRERLEETNQIRERESREEEIESEIDDRGRNRTDRD